MASTAKAKELSVRASPSVRDDRKQATVPASTSTSHRAACHQRRRKLSSNNAPVNAQNTTLLPADRASRGIVQGPSWGEKPAAEVMA
jgi:hypothetical protein